MTNNYENCYHCNNNHNMAYAMNMEKLKLLEGECIITIPQIDIEQMFLDYREHIREINEKIKRGELNETYKRRFSYDVKCIGYLPSRLH